MIGTAVRVGAGMVASVLVAAVAAVQVGQSDLSVGTQLQIFTGLTVFGAVLTGILSAVRMARAADMPLWTQPDDYGRKQHGFLNWWGTLLGIWVVFLLVLFVFVPTLVEAADMISAMWTDAG